MLNQGIQSVWACPGKMCIVGGMENTPPQEKEYHQWVLEIKTLLDIVIEFLSVLLCCSLIQS